MAYTLCIAQRKGGAGKTTLACQLAVAFKQIGFVVGLIDTDPQASLTYWHQQRQTAPKPSQLARPVAEDFMFDNTSRYGFPRLVKDFQRHCEIVIVDTPPTTDYAVQRAMACADLILSPLQLSPLDLDASIATAQLIDRAGQPALFVINRSPARARIANLIREQMKQSGLPVSRTEIGNRTAYSESLASGCGVLETHARTSPACQEIQSLADEILTYLQAQRRAA